MRTFIAITLDAEDLQGIYQCPECDQLTLGTRRCEDCNLFSKRIGSGGSCPHCDEPVTLEDLITTRPAKEDNCANLTVPQ